VGLTTFGACTEKKRGAQKEAAFGLSATTGLPSEPGRCLDPLFFETLQQFPSHGGVYSASEEPAICHPEVDHGIYIDADQYEAYQQYEFHNYLIYHIPELSRLSQRDVRRKSPCRRRYP